MHGCAGSSSVQRHATHLVCLCHLHVPGAGQAILLLLLVEKAWKVYLQSAATRVRNMLCPLDESVCIVSRVGQNYLGTSGPTLTFTARALSKCSVVVLWSMS